MSVTPPQARSSLADAAALIAGVRGAVWLSADGEVESIPLDEAARRLKGGAPALVCHGRATARRLGVSFVDAFDLLELFAFVHPARFCLPTPRGLAQALDLPLPATMENEAECLIAAARILLDGLDDAEDSALAVGRAMAAGGWPWAPAVLSALGAGEAPNSAAIADGLMVWKRIGEWTERAPGPPSANQPVSAPEARKRLAQLVGAGAEARPQQADYAAACAAAFAPRDKAGAPNFVLADAGTGVGKTLGYIAPASMWAEKNRGCVWISTFTRNLQRQLDGELDRLYPDPAEKAAQVVVRKGRENYFCLLNFEEAVRRVPAGGGADAAALGLMARWALASRDGDMVGGDFPAWLADLLGRGTTLDLTDTRGECIYSACPHYRKCFVERSIRRARRAAIVVANHALVLTQAALGPAVDTALPERYVIDEGHHLFAAADGAFSAHLSGHETAELRRWIVGPEEGSRSRSRGLRARIEDLVAGDEAAAGALNEAVRAARALPGPGWRRRLLGGTPVGLAEAFLGLVRQQVYARDSSAAAPYSLETDTKPPVAGLLDAAGALESALARLGVPLAALIKALAALLDDNAEEMDSASRMRIDSVLRGLERRGVLQLQGWRAMLASLGGDIPAEFIDWMGVERFEGRDIDLGLHRHWVDPTRPFAEAVAGPAHGMVVTSATLLDVAAGGEGEVDGWAAAEQRTGACHLARPAERVQVPSPFDYPALTRIFVVGDVARDDPGQVAAAYRELFLAAGGGSLGLFTAIARLRAVHESISDALDQAGVHLLAQHVEALDTGTLIDIFRAEENSCLLGTDAVRDGVDVPGRSLRLIVFDRVPWPRPDILHRARRDAFGGRAFDEMLARLKLKQAFGRLVRRAADKGVFVMLDSALPSRLLGAFPEGVAVRRLGLAETVAETRAFLEQG